MILTDHEINKILWQIDKKRTSDHITIDVESCSHWQQYTLLHVRSHLHKHYSISALTVATSAWRCAVSCKYPPVGPYHTPLILDDPTERNQGGSGRQT
jgi:hypothetical protein